jgi:hypothetical protein
MLERNFYTDDFEDLLRQKTDPYKMYPSDKVWNSIHASLHARKRRFVAGMSILICGILFLAGKELLAPSKSIADSRKLNASAQEAKTAEPKAYAPIGPSLAFSSLKKLESADPTAPGPEAERAGLQPAWPMKVQEPIEQVQGSILASPLAVEGPAIRETGTNVFVSADFSNGSASPYGLPDRVIVSPVSERHEAEQPSVKAVEPLRIPASGLKQAPLSPDEQTDQLQINWLLDYASENLVPAKKPRTDWVLYLSPTVNYRGLMGNSNYSVAKPSVQNVPIALVQYSTTNEFVDNTPALGFEAGGGLKYHLTRNLSFLGSIQFNYLHYTIRTYQSSGPQPATIVLNSPATFYGVAQDSIMSYSNLRNFGGKSAENLQNRYFEISMPLGLELRVLGNDRLQFNLAATIQPTYLLNRNGYVLTTDFASYTKAPSLYRKWNLNSGFEAFLSYQTGKLRWQIGPEIRYQILSTYSNQYPFKENLVGYGIRIGVSKAIW